MNAHAITGPVLLPSDFDRVQDLVASTAIRWGKLGDKLASMSRTPFPMRHIYGCCFSVYRDSAIAVGGFDENFTGPAHQEDTDFGARLAAQGYGISYEKGCWIVHLKAQSGGCRVGQKGTPESWSSLGWWIYWLRHRKNSEMRFFRLLWNSLRNGPLRKAIVLRPWRWPWAWGSYLWGIYEGWRRSKRIKSPFVSVSD